MYQKACYRLTNYNFSTKLLGTDKPDSLPLNYLIRE